MAVDKVLNPKTNRMIQVGSSLYRKLVKEGVIQPEVVPLRQVEEIAQNRRALVCPDGTVMNPKTKKCIKIEGELHRKLLKQGVIFHDVEPVVNLNDAEKKPTGAKCKDKDQVRNPETNRCIKIGSEIYRKLTRKGVKFFDDDLPVKNTEEKKTKKTNPRESCLNNETFVMYHNIKSKAEVPDEDFIMLPSGYCFAISELVDFIKSSGFNNRNPHLISQQLFDMNEIQSLQNKELHDALSAFFEKQRQQRDDEAEIVYNDMDILYEIGKAGRICYFDQISSFEAENTGSFEYSVEALVNLVSEISSLPQKLQDVFYNLRSSNTAAKLRQLIDDANNGRSCIHGVGLALIKLFATYFNAIEARHKNVKYDPLRTGLIFFVDKSRVGFQNMECRLYINTLDFYYTNLINQFPTYTKSSSLYWERKRTYKKMGLSLTFLTCSNQSDYSTLDSKDSWSDVDDWRKISIYENSQKYCFDILFLIKTITNQLNTQKNANPYPVYPANPFTRHEIRMKDLTNIRRRISINYIKISDSLAKFLYNPESLWSDDAVYVNSNRWRDTFVNVYERDMRFVRLLNSYENDTLEITGYWANKNTVMTQEERTVLIFLDNPGDTGALRQLKSLRPHVLPDSYYFSEQLTTASLSKITF